MCLTAFQFSRDVTEIKGTSWNCLLRLQIFWLNAWQMFVQQLFKDSVCSWLCSSKQNVVGHEVSHIRVFSSTFLYHIICVKFILFILFAVLHSTQKSVSSILLGCLGARLSELKQKVVSENPQEYGVAVPRE